MAGVFSDISNLNDGELNQLFSHNKVLFKERTLLSGLPDKTEKIYDALEKLYNKARRQAQEAQISKGKPADAPLGVDDILPELVSIIQQDQECVSVDVCAILDILIEKQEESGMNGTAASVIASACKFVLRGKSEQGRIIEEIQEEMLQTEIQNTLESEYASDTATRERINSLMVNNNVELKKRMIEKKLINENDNFYINHFFNFIKNDPNLDSLDEDMKINARKIIELNEEMKVISDRMRIAEKKNNEKIRGLRERVNTLTESFLRPIELKKQALNSSQNSRLANVESQAPQKSFFQRHPWVKYALIGLAIGVGIAGLAALSVVTFGGVPALLGVGVAVAGIVGASGAGATALGLSVVGVAVAAAASVVAVGIGKLKNWFASRKQKKKSVDSRVYHQLQSDVDELERPISSGRRGSGLSLPPNPPTLPWLHGAGSEKGLARSDQAQAVPSPAPGSKKGSNSDL